MLANIFVYGTLQNKEVVKALTGKSFKKNRASLHNYAVLQVKGEHFPGMIESSGSVVEGFVLLNVDEASQKVFDVWEGKKYSKISVKVEFNSSLTAAVAYVWKDTKQLEGNWSNDGYRKGHMRECISKCIPQELGNAFNADS